MEVTLSWAETNFDKFNKEFFSGILPMPTLELTDSIDSFNIYGEFIAATDDSKEICVIKISEVYEGPEEFFADTLIHEMIHYYLHYTNKEDATPHGPNFRRECRRINKFGWSLGTYGSVEMIQKLKLRYIF